MYYYSASTGGFYTHEIHGDNIPADAVKITTKEHTALIQAQAEGSQIVADPKGRPIAQASPPQSNIEQLKTAKDAAIREEGTKRLAALSAPYATAGIILGQQQVLLAKVWSAKTTKELAAISWPE